MDTPITSEPLDANLLPRSVIDVAGIMRLLPHRYPFLLIDRIVNVIRGQSGIGIKNVTMNDYFFQGHFPNHPVMPGVLIIEAMAQTSAALVVDDLGAKAAGHTVYFMSITNAKFRRPVGPGDRLELHCEQIHRRATVWRFSGVGKVDGHIVAEASFAAMIVATPNG